MIYKVEVGDFTTVEIEVDAERGVAYAHIQQGYEEGGTTKYTKYMNFSLCRKQCEDLIKSLRLGLIDIGGNNSTKPILCKSTSILDSGLPTRTVNILKYRDIEVLEDLERFKKRDLLKLRGISKKSISLIEECLLKVGIIIS